MKDRVNSLANTVVLLVCVLLVSVLLLGSLVRTRTTARGSACADNLRTLGLALHNYHSAYKRFPMGSGGTTGNDDPALSNGGRLGPLVGITPFVEHQALWEQISNPYPGAKSGQLFPPMGPSPSYDSSDYTAWAKGPEMFRCPESTALGERQKPAVVYTLQSPEGDVAVLTSYVASFGDGTHLQGELLSDPPDPMAVRRRMAANRGAFMTSQSLGIRDFLDGTSNTLLFSETIASEKRNPGKSEVIKDIEGLSMNPQLCLDAAEGKPEFWEFGRGSRWCDGAPVVSGFQTVLPPNSPSCTSDLGVDDVIASASSLHPSGVHGLMCDGSVAFFSDLIDTGDLTTSGVSIGDDYSPPGSKSPYGLWGALGSRASGEIIEQPLDYVQGNRNAFNRGRGRGQGGSGMLVWRDRAGKVQLKAEFLEIKDKNTIRLKSGSGTIHEVPLNTLRPQDIYRAVRMDLLKNAK